jgi:tetratricopeptide (TPR) repeat protein
MADNIAYPGNSALPREVRDKVFSTLRHSLNLYRAGKALDCAVGCEFILKMDPRFGPAKRLLEKARNPAANVDLAEIEGWVKETPAPPERTGGDSPDRLLISAIEAYAERDFSRAIENANRVLAALPGNNDAREILEKAKRKRDLQPHVENFRQRALFALEAGQTEEAKLNFERMRSLDPEHPEVEKIASRLEGGAPPATPASVPLEVPAFDLEMPPLSASLKPPPPPDWSPAATPFTAESPAPGGMEGLDLGPLSESPPLSEWASVSEPGSPAAPSFTSEAGPQAPQPNFADLWGPPEAPPTGAAPSGASASSEEIQKLLREGDELASRNPQAAIETWSRVFLLDLGNADATSRIEGARERLAETNRRVADALKAGRSLYDGGQLKEAREKFLEVLAIDENEPTARSFLQRIEDDFSRPQGSYDLSLTSPQGDVLAEDDLAPGAPSAPAVPERAPKETPAARRRLPLPLLAAAGGLVLATAIGLYFVLRPAPRMEIPKNAPPARVVKHGGPAAAAPSETASAPIPVPKATAPPPAAAEEKRAEAEKSLAGHRYIAALTAFNLAAPAYPGDPGFHQEMAQAAQRVGEISPAVKLYNDGDYETALPILWRLFQADKENEDVKSYLVRAYYNLGVIDLQNNLFDKASKALGEALSVDSNDLLTKRQKAFADRYLRQPPDLLARIYVKYLRPRP